MAREWRRLLVDPARLAACAGALALGPAETHYLRRVLRLRSGDRFAVIDGGGRLWSARLEGPDQAQLEQPLAEPLESQPMPAPRLELLVVPPKRDTDVLLRMACELGIDQLTLLQAQRRVAGPLATERTEAIVREACEQSERLWLPQLALDLALAQAFTPADGAAAGLRCLATTRHGGLPRLVEVLGSVGQEPTGAPAGGPELVRVAIGPEGGWTPAEEELALSCGWQPVSLGPTILRTSTAAVAAAAQLAAWRAG